MSCEFISQVQPISFVEDFCLEGSFPPAWWLVLFKMMPDPSARVVKWPIEQNPLVWQEDKKCESVPPVFWDCLLHSIIYPALINAHPYRMMCTQKWEREAKSGSGISSESKGTEMLASSEDEQPYMPRSFLLVYSKIIVPYHFIYDDASQPQNTQRRPRW